MKKNISINISGIIFHIEEDGYEQLKNYLESISKYFSNFSDSKEIISDIEGRIAEIFLGKLSDSKQVITAEDVTALIATMGSVADFQAIEDDATEAEPAYDQKSNAEKEWENAYTKKEFKRDIFRKILGGVCSGLAGYFNMDPLWIRLLTIILTIATGGLFAIVYIILWVVLPEVNEPIESKNLKKMFRNPENKVLAGVAGGVAAYFGIDVNLTRVLFVVFTLFGGTGAIVYFILWIILPEAHSITDRVQMKGEPVTLSNIESNIKNEFNVREGEENVFIKLILLPFRVLSTVFNTIAKALGPLLGFFVEFIRILFGGGITAFGVFLAFSVVVTTGIVSGLLSGTYIYDWSIDGHKLSEPILLFFQSIPDITYFFAFIVAFVPSLFVILLGISIISKRIVFSSTTGWSLAGLFIVGIVILSVSVPGIIYNFHEDGSFEEMRSYSIPENKVLVLKTDRSRGIDNFEDTDIYLKGHNEPQVVALIEFKSQGASREDAIKNAKNASYNIEQEDSVLTFDYNLSLENLEDYRFQEVDITLKVPYNRPFKMDSKMSKLLGYSSIGRYGYRSSQVRLDNTWVMTEAGLECLNCDKFEGYGRRSDSNFSRIIEVEKFSGLTVNSSLNVEIRKSDEQRVELVGEEKFIENVIYKINERGELELSLSDSISSARNFTMKRDDLVIKISVPSLEKLDLRQASFTKAFNLDLPYLEVELNGASKAELEGDIEKLEINMNGNSHLNLTGTGNQFEISANGASDVNASRFRAKDVSASAKGASTVRVYASETIQVSRDVLSSVQQRGPAKQEQ